MSVPPGLEAIPSVTQNGLMSSCIAVVAPALTKAFAKSMGSVPMEPAK
jgi:hypothetical protein